MLSSPSTRIVGLLLGMLMLLSWVNAKGTKHDKLHDDLEHKLNIIPIEAVKQADPVHGWEVVIIYPMVGHAGDKAKPVTVTSSHLIGKDTTVEDLLSDKPGGLHSHESVVAMLRQSDHDGDLKDVIKAIEGLPNFCKPGGHTDKCYNHDNAYTANFHENTDLTLFRINGMVDTDKKIGGKDHELVVEPGKKKVTVVQFLEKHRKEIHENGGGHNNLQQITFKSVAGRRIGVIFLMAKNKGGKAGTKDADTAPPSAAGVVSPDAV